jgi:hypothetical protein
MKLFSQITGGIGDILLYMMRSGSHLGYFPALKARGDSTMLSVHANTDAAIQLLERLPHVDHIQFRGKTLRIDGPKDFEILRTWDRLPWQQPHLALDDEEQRILADITREPYIAVHVAASQSNKAPPHTDKLLAGLAATGRRTVVLGVETSDDGPAIMGNRMEGMRAKLAGTPHILLPPKLRLHIAVAQHATKFIGTLSCFNCAAQLAHVPSFVLVNRSIQEPNIYRMMSKNGAHAEAWNITGGPPLDVIYKRAIGWAKL